MITPVERYVLRMSDKELKQTTKELLQFHQEGFLKEGFFRESLRWMKNCECYQNMLTSERMPILEKVVFQEVASRWIAQQENSQ